VGASFNAIALPSPRRYPCAMSTFEVSTDKETQLAQRMAALGVREADIEESFVRSRADTADRTLTRWPLA